MCGFHGIVASRPLAAADLRRLEHGTNLLRHRGPDDEGYVIVHRDGRAQRLRGNDSIGACADQAHIHAATPGGESVALGARRLAIVDLTPDGHMPMPDDRGNWLVFNGEIYNHQELRQQLVALGFQFHSTGDTEVLLHAYAQWGSGCLERCNGMWAFALWDHARQRLFCARDRFGEKQLYYATASDGSFCFASEIAPLRWAVPEQVNRPLVWDFLMYGLADHTAETFFSGIEQLAPGTYLKFANRRVETVRYYDLRAKTVPVPARLSRAASVLREYLADSVRLRMRSDVPVASFLSGGLDSSSIVALADQYLGSLNGHSPQKALRTYTNAYPEGDRYDESPAVRAALKTLPRTDPHFIQASASVFQSGLLEMVKAQEQPFHNASIFASFHLLRMIRQQAGVKVVLTGEAGDELLAGYQRLYLPLHLSHLLASGQARNWFREASAWSWPTALRASAKGFFRKLPAEARAGLQRWRNPVVELMRPEFFREHAHRDHGLHHAWRELDLNPRLVADILQFNLPQLLRHLDRNAMHWSVETRVPFLDHRLVEFAACLPEEWKMHDGYSKFILRQAMARDLPAEILENRGKLGFGMAEQFWLRDCLPLLESSAGIEEFVDLAELRRRIAGNGGQANQAYWLPISLGLWMQTAFPGTH
jgi:asparagine synthase (glutamine-hydrolysing)